LPKCCHRSCCRSLPCRSRRGCTPWLASCCSAHGYLRKARKPHSKKPLCLGGAQRRQRPRTDLSQCHCP
jgi:hypothetical protein